MMIAQGWYNGKVNAIVISRCQNGMDGWQIYKAVYDPSQKQTLMAGADWTLLSSSHNLEMLITTTVINEMATWQAGDKEMKSLLEVMTAIQQQTVQIAQYIKATCAPQS